MALWFRACFGLQLANFSLPGLGYVSRNRDRSPK
jgi:hypothetical protein